MMNRFRTGKLALLLSAAAFSATAQDNDYNFLAYRFSANDVPGTARFRALGGAGTSLGADLSSAYTNPAGLGFYTRSEINLSPTLVMPNNSVRYITDGQTSRTNAFALGNLGVALSSANRNPVGTNRWRGTWAITYSQLANFSNSYRFGGVNDRSTMSDYFASRLNDDFRDNNRRPEDYADDLAANGPNFDSPNSMYYYGLIVEPNFNYTPSNGQLPYFGVYSGAPTGTIRQDFQSDVTGRVNQWNVAYGANFNDFFYLGASVGLANLTYTSKKSSTESFIAQSGVAQPPVSSYTFTNDLTTTGRGLNLTVGTIIRPNDMLRIGASIATPTWYTMNESLSYGLRTELNSRAYPNGYEVSANTNPEFTSALPADLQRAGYAIANRGGVNYITSVPRLSVLPFESTYRLTTPWRASLGTSLFFGKNAFITLEGEYVMNRGTKISSTDQNADPDILDGFVQEDIRRYYQNAWNLKAGAEYRLSHLYLRAGANYQSDPFKKVGKFNDDIDRSRLTVSGGVGYRAEKFYVDLAVSSQRQIGTNAPYVLPGQSDRYYFARATTNTLSTTLSIGTYF